MQQKLFFICAFMFGILFQNCSKTKFEIVDNTANKKVETVSVDEEEVVEQLNVPPPAPEVPTQVTEISTVTTTTMPTPVTAITPPPPPPPPAPLGKFYCQRRSGSKSVLVEDLYEKWSDGSYTLKEKCSDWHTTDKENHSYNCGVQDGLPLNRGYASCCPIGMATVNGKCTPEAGMGESCYASANCKAGLTCRDKYENGESIGRFCLPKN